MVEAGRKIHYIKTPLYPMYPNSYEYGDPVETLARRIMGSTLIADRLKVDGAGNMSLPDRSIRVNQFCAFTNRQLVETSYHGSYPLRYANMQEARALRNTNSQYLREGQVLLAPTSGNEPYGKFGNIHVFGTTPDGYIGCRIDVQPGEGKTLSSLVFSRLDQTPVFPLPKVPLKPDTIVIVGSTLSDGRTTSLPVAIQENMTLTYAGQSRNVTFVAIPGLAVGALALKGLPDGSLAIEQLAPFYDWNNATFFSNGKHAIYNATVFSQNYASYKLGKPRAGGFGSV